MNDPSCSFQHVNGWRGLAVYLTGGAITTCADLQERPKWPDYDKVFVIDDAATPPPQGPPINTPEVGTSPPHFLMAPDGVTIRGGRHGVRLGPELAQSEQVENTAFTTLGNDIRFTGLRLRGPTRSTGDGITCVQLAAIGIHARERVLTNWRGTYRLVLAHLHRPQRPLRLAAEGRDGERSRRDFRTSTTATHCAGSRTRSRRYDRWNNARTR